MSHIKVEVDGKLIFDGEVTDWTPLPTPPEMPRGPMKAADMPPTIRTIMAKTLTTLLEQATGFRITVHN